MKNIIYYTLLSSLLFSLGGVVKFNDGTTIEGDIQSVSLSAINIIPVGLTFSEDIRVENVDSLKLYDGNVLIANSDVIYLYQDGEFLDPAEITNEVNSENDYDLEYVIVPNWSMNIYTGYPMVPAGPFDEYNENNIVNGFSIGSPYGIFAGDFFMNVIAEFAYYNFVKTSNNNSFGGIAFQIGISPGLFVGGASVSLTASTGAYQSEEGEYKSGFILGGSLDLPLGPFIIDRYGDKDFIENLEGHLESLEIRITSRSNLIQKGNGYTGWIDDGISIGYEF